MRKCIAVLLAFSLATALAATPPTEPTQYLGGGGAPPRGKASTPGAAPAPVAANEPVPTLASPAMLNDTAHFLAGLPIAPKSPLAAFNTEAHWVEHSTFLNLAWAKLDARTLRRIKRWDTASLPGPSPVLYYMFSGPDYLYADTFSPNASTYILCGLEPLGGVPDISKTTAETLPPTLKKIETSLATVLKFGYFITKDMRVDLENEQAQGTIPIFLIFLARSHHEILDASYVNLDSSGTVHYSDGGKAGHGSIPGVRITFRHEGGGPKKTLYYFTTDISDGGIHENPGFLRFCNGFGNGDSLLKSASYLLHSDGFSTIRSFLLSHSHAVLEDDSGIPISYFTPDKWTMRVFGNYVGPIGLFAQYYQPKLEDLFKESNPAPIDFGMGYRWDARHTSFILAVRR